MTEVQPNEAVVFNVGSDSAFAKQEAMANEVLTKQGKIIPILKVARAGATTSLVKQAVENNKKLVICVPTHEIGEDTVKSAVLQSKCSLDKIIHFHENRQDCKRLVLECQKNPRLLNAKWLLRPEKCEKCTFFNDPSCDLQKVLNCSDWNVLIVTYQKLKALWLSKDYSKISQLQLQKIREAEIAIFDEYSISLTGLTPSAKVSDEKCTSLLNIVVDDNDDWWVSMLQIALAAQEFGMQLNKNQSGKFENPLSKEALTNLQANFVGAWNKVKNLTAKGINTEYLQDILQVACYKELLINKDRKGCVTLTPIEPLERELSLFNAFANEFTMQGKLSILVDAHLPEFDLQEHFDCKVEPFMWGDPNNTNDKIVYFCDTRKIWDADVYHEKTRTYLTACINKICNLHKNAGRPLIVCTNKSVAKEVQRWQNRCFIPDAEITWYRSTKTRGVQAKGNVEIMIGGPYIPLSSYLHKVAKEQDAIKADAWNRAFRKTNSDAEYVNASTRVKDPKGIYQSYVYCLGITKLEVMSFLNLNGQLYASGEVKRPDVIGCVKTDLNLQEWVAMTELYRRKNEIVGPEKHLPYILELRRLYLINKDKANADYIPIQLAFRTKSKEAKEAILANTRFLDSLGLYVEKQGRGFRLKLNDKKPY